MEATSATSTTLMVNSAITYHRFSRRFPVVTISRRQLWGVPSTFPSSLTLSPPRDHHHHHLFRNVFVSCSSLPADPTTSSDQIAVLLEVDGVLVDTYRSGNRQAFNLGAEEATKDLLAISGVCNMACIGAILCPGIILLGDYYDIGWPTSLPTSEKETFMKSVLEEKKKALAYSLSKETPFRPGVEKFIDDACDERICVVILAASSKVGEETGRAIVEKLGLGRVSKLKVVGEKETENSFYGQLVRGVAKVSGLNEELANEAIKAANAERKRIAEEVASLLKLHVDIGTGSAESIREIVAALRAGAEIADVPVSRCVLVAGSQLAVAAAETIGMPCIFLRSRLTSRVELPSPVTVMDGFGNVGLTVSKLRSKLSASSAK